MHSRADESARDGFDEHPGRFTCIYPNSQREFTFNNDGVDEACLTADDGDTITIEIDGIRSATISEQQLDGPERLAATPGPWSSPSRHRANRGKQGLGRRDRARLADDARSVVATSSRTPPPTNARRARRISR